MVIQQVGGTESLGFPLPESPCLLVIRGIVLSAARQCSSFLLQQENLTPVINWTDVNLKYITWNSCDLSAQFLIIQIK